MNLQKVCLQINSGMVSKDNSVSQVLRNWWVFFSSDFVTCFFCIYRVIYLTDLYAGLFTTKIKKNILLFRTGPLNFVKQAWMGRSEYLFENHFFCLLHPTWRYFNEQIFSNQYLSCFKGQFFAVSQNVIFMFVIYLHFSNYKFFFKVLFNGLI